MTTDQTSIDRICQQRGLPTIERGALCKVNGKHGKILRGNVDGYFEVLFCDGIVRNCKPDQVRIG